MRSAEAAARGTMTNMMVAMSTENRICRRTVRKAVRSPMGMRALAIWLLPNHMMATVERLRMSVSDREHQREQPVDAEGGRA